MACGCTKNRQMFEVFTKDDDGTVKVINEFQQKPVADRYANGIPGAQVRPKAK
ncbi:hypothetical protein SUDANB1_05663 [Streptomyces sp. enrichment culture]|uniref:hypothetical protein n=1 Tax=Streptomyces sp. enrichment culture TaxID=1795815 RepID=UPI003F573760